MTKITRHYVYPRKPWYLSKRAEACMWLFLLAASVAFTAYIMGKATCEGVF